MKKTFLLIALFITNLFVSCSSDDSAEQAPTPTTNAPTLSGFTIPAKTVGDLPFSLTAPTSNSPGTFTYTSSNPAVATVSGNTVTIIGAGTTVIKALQAASGNFKSGEISANLVVTNSGAPTGLRTIYVATTGNDTNNGTIDKPYLTINKAAQVAIAGDVVIIKSGTYKPTSSIVVTNSGTASNPITFYAETKDAVIIDGSDSTTPNASDRQGLFTILGTSTATKNWIVIDGLRVINSKWAGIFARFSDNIIVKNCSTKNTWASGIIAANSSNIKVLNNKVQEACMHPTKSENTNECITIASVNTFEVAYNTVSDRPTDPSNGGEGIDAKNACINGTIHHNTLTNLFRTAIYVDAYAIDLFNVEVYNNKVYNTGSGITVASEEGGTVTNVKIHNNLVYNIQGVGIRIAGWLRNGPIKDISVYQNTVVRCGVGKTASAWENCSIMLEADNVLNTNFIVRNNICAESTNQMRWKDQRYVTIDNNIVFGLSTVTGTNAIILDPQFVNSAGSDFNLKAGSPAINKAIGTPMSTKDFTDFTRDSKPDIGAFEYR